MDAAEELPEREQRGLDRCRRALERGRRIRGRVVASGDQGLLLDVRGAVAHLPAEEARDLPGSGGLRPASPRRFAGWVVAVGADLVHVSARRPGTGFAGDSVRRGEVVTTGRSGGRVRLEGENAFAPDRSGGQARPGGDEASAPDRSGGQARPGGDEASASDRSGVRLRPEGEGASAADRSGGRLRPEGEGASAADRSSGRVRPAGEDASAAEDASTAVLPWEELSWQPMLAPPELEPGTVVAGHVVGITLDGPVLSPRSLLPTPWPAIALALPPGTRVPARVEAVDGENALVRTSRSPRAAAIVPADQLPAGVGEGAHVEAVVVEVNPIAGLLVLGELSPRGPSSRALRLVGEDETPGRPGPEQAASGSRS